MLAAKSVPKQYMQKKVKVDCYTQDAHLKSVMVSTVRRLLERLGKTTRRMLVSKVSVSTLSVAPAVAGLENFRSSANERAPL